jgi:DNA invertase Pin-like site-specific DNA recombinase
MAKKRAERTRWVSYLRVSTVEQAEKELSLTAQRRSAEEFSLSELLPASCP